MSNRNLRLLIGDNPFHGISHLSQVRARERSEQNSVEQAARLVELSLQNGADGFMFSVDETTLSILAKLRQKGSDLGSLYAIAPYAYEYVRKATQGGVASLASNFARELLFSSNIKVVASNAAKILKFDLVALLETYVAYELSRIKAVTDKKSALNVFMLHEIITDMALALNMEKLCKGYINFLEDNNVKAGFETRNFPYLVNKFSEWGLDFSRLTLTSSFNKVGFQMCPSQCECEEALERAQDAEVIAMSVLAAGYLKPAEAIGYLANLRGISGVVIGVSKERHATETFHVFRGDMREPVYVGA
ncbi:MAG: hypothetical protein ACQCN4_05880 [Candidatus Bathyarchaeia archaeon]